MIKSRIIVGLSALMFMWSYSVLPASAEEKKVFVPVEFTSAYLTDASKFEMGKEIWFDRQSLIEKYAIIAEFRMFEAIWDKANKEGIIGVNF